MTSVGNGECQRIINQVKEYIKANAPHQEADLLEQFAQRYFSSCALEDLKNRSVEELYGILFSHWQFIYQRGPHQAKIRIFNPQASVDGWHSTHTVIQISHDDIPFLVDSARMVINHYHLQIHFILHFGGLKLLRDQQHNIIDILPVGKTEKNAQSEAPIYIEIDRILDEKMMNDLRVDIEQVLCDVRVSVADWRKMVVRVEECLNELENNPPALALEGLVESRDFLRWLINNNFTFLGARDYKLIGNESNRALQIVPGSGLGAFALMYSLT